MNTVRRTVTERARVRLRRHQFTGYTGRVAGVRSTMYDVRLTHDAEGKRIDPFESGPYFASELEVLK